MAFSFDEIKSIYQKKISNKMVIMGAGSSLDELSEKDIKLLEIRQKDHYVSLKKISKVNKFEHKVWLIETNEKGKMYVDIKKLENYLS